MKQAVLILLACIFLAACQQTATPAVFSTTAVPSTRNVSPTTNQTETALPAGVPTPSPIATRTKSAVNQPTLTSTSSPSLGILADCPPETDLSTIEPAGVVMAGDQQAWYWDVKENQLQPYPLPDPDDGKWRQIEISADGRFLAYQMPADEPPPTDRPRLDYSGTQQRDQELWLLDRQRGQSRQIAGPPPEETVQRYLDEPEFNYEARWVEGSHLLGFSNHPANGETPTYEAYQLLDADTGRSWTLFSGGEVEAVTFRPDRLQAAAIATSGV